MKNVHVNMPKSLKKERGTSMMKMKLALISAVISVGILTACSDRTETQVKEESTAASSTTASESVTQKDTLLAKEENEPAADTITIMVPPITSNYVELLDGWIEDYKKDHPNIEIEVTATTWAENTSKLTTMALAGEAPDIAEVDMNMIGPLAEMGVAVDLEQYLDAETLADYDRNSLDYLRQNDILYGLPLYLTIQALGGNRAMLEEAGADIEKIQTSGWTYDEFLKIVAAGTKEGTWGFIFANQGVAAADVVNIFGVSAGITNAFTSDFKYAFTSENMLQLLTAIEDLVKSGYMPNYGIETGQRWAMLETGETMIAGKAMPLTESTIRKNNAGIADGTATEGSIEVEYVFLPTPAMEGVDESCYGIVDGMVPLRNNGTTDQHMKNVCEFLNYICSGERIAAVDDEVMLPSVCESGRQAQANRELEQYENNAAAAARCISLVKVPPVGISSEQTSKASTLMNEVIVPKFQALLAGEVTAQNMYEEICQAAIAEFGESSCEMGRIP